MCVYIDVCTTKFLNNTQVLEIKLIPHFYQCHSYFSNLNLLVTLCIAPACDGESDKFDKPCPLPHPLINYNGSYKGNVCVCVFPVSTRPTCYNIRGKELFMASSLSALLAENAKVNKRTKQNKTRNSNC